MHACVRLLQRGMRVIVLPHTQVCTNKMNLSDEVDLEDYVSRPDKISAAEISAVCQEAGMHAVRKNRWERLAHLCVVCVIHVIEVCYSMSRKGAEQERSGCACKLQSWWCNVLGCFVRSSRHAVRAMSFGTKPGKLLQRDWYCSHRQHSVKGGGYVARVVSGWRMARRLRTRACISS